MKRNRSDAWLLIVYIFIGGLVGGILGKVVSYIPYMEFVDKVSKSNIFSVAFDPLFDIGVLRFGFSFDLGINIGSIIGIIVAIAIWSRTR